MIIDMGEWLWAKEADKSQLQQLREWLREDGGSETVQLRMQATILRRLKTRDQVDQAQLEAHLKATW